MVRGMGWLAQLSHPLCVYGAGPGLKVIPSPSPSSPSPSKKWQKNKNAVVFIKLRQDKNNYIITDGFDQKRFCVKLNFHRRTQSPVNVF